MDLNLSSNDCAIPGREECLTEEDKATQALLSFLRKEGVRPRNIIQDVKKLLGVDKEIDIWRNPKIRAFLGKEICDKVLKEKYKPSGPAHSVELLNDRHIDETLRQWSINSQEMFKKKFLHIPFQMIDFVKNDTELNRLSLGEAAKRYDCWGVVLNTDVSSGPGKHWFCLYGDFGHAGTPEDPYTLEFFNSSGNPPVNELAIWIGRVIHELRRDYQKHCLEMKVVMRRLQHSHTECGMWSLMYIRSRLEGKGPDWFYERGIDDQLMIEARDRLFRES